MIFVKGQGAFDTVKEKLPLIAHRGPDHQTILQGKARGKPWSLGFCRLSINDTSALGHQPFVQGDYIAAVNGEIYNAKALVERYNLTVKSQSDCEVVLALFLKLGPRCIELFDGFFAAIIFNTTSGKLNLFRDDLGKKPLFQGLNDQQDIYASEFKAIAGFEWVKSVERGLWGPRDNISEPLPSNAVSPQQVRQTLSKALDKRMQTVSQKKLGVFLSGGLDSAILAYLIHTNYPQVQVNYYSLVHEGEGDSPYVNALVESLGIPTERLRSVNLPNESELLQGIEKLVYQTESWNPSIVTNGFCSYLLAQAAKEDGVKVVITGDGADEVFLGYRLSGNTTADNFQSRRKELIYHLANTELRRLDLSTMAHGVEARCPYLDKDVRTLADDLKYDQLFDKPTGQNKMILRHSFQGLLPDTIINQEKRSMDVGSRLQRHIISAIEQTGSCELDYLKNKWLEFFGETGMVDDSYAWSYRAFDGYRSTRRNKWQTT